ncbi:hypothetical protein [Lacticaseibacillus porcinae]|uniref:hypothetical protein n=1 Tax=Lacticaseibacillus porcinae TaxID=1123687 RepID=UPI000F783174|nr:hypothetical protein [Lacticaseibacillus porcinae]
MPNSKPVKVALSWLQIVLLPMLYMWSAGIQWSVGLVATLLFALSLAGARSGENLNWWLIAATVFGVVAASVQWWLLPVILAQVVYGALINSQKLSQPLEITLWTISVFFAQMVVLYQLMHGTTWQLLLLLAVLLLPQIVSVWADRLPLWLGLLLLVVIAVVGYFSGQLTLIAAGALVVINAATSTRVVKINASLQALASVLIGVIFILSRLHG